MSMGPTILMYGTSPRTRGKQLNVPNITPSRRNIPAHAGKTLQLRPRGERAAEHPRARGENVSIAEPFSRGNGTSPRTRGKQKSVIHSNADLRNIPAHAGKTPTFDYPHGRTSEHPRARGENIERPLQPLGSLGTSPRTRGKRDNRFLRRCTGRNIPAHAGKTVTYFSGRRTTKEHPRARGENLLRILISQPDAGTSPRTRGKQHKHQISSKLHRNIPAHAGKTWGWRCRFPWCAEHPRARGENSTPATRPRRRRGTSPRTRGKLRFGIRFDIFERNIPAHAGKTAV